MPAANQQILLKNRPGGEPTEADFELVEQPAPAPAEGQLLCRTIYLSLDPYMRGRMNAGRSYAEPVRRGAVMCGGTVSQVVQSRHSGFAEGEFVLGANGWQAYAVSDGQGLRKLDPQAAPLSYALGVLGMPGMTAYVGLLDIGQPKAGETVVVSAATGAVGSVAGQIARIKGCRTVGVAGSDEKCRIAVEEFGYDACINRTAADLPMALRQGCPNGIDVYFENVGGPVFQAVLMFINQGARIPLVGLISQYNERALPAGPNLMPLLVKRAKIQGMMVFDHAAREPDFLRDVGGWLREGRIRYRETIVAGLANAARAFIGLFHGANIGKLLVKVADPEGRADAERPPET